MYVLFAAQYTSILFRFYEIECVCVGGGGWVEKGGEGGAGGGRGGQGGGGGAGVGQGGGGGGGNAAVVECSVFNTTALTL